MADDDGHGFLHDTGKALQKASIRAFDVSEETARRGWRSQQRRVSRWRSRLFMIVQISIAAGLSWWIAHDLLGHSEPFLATVAAIICLGFSFGQRLARVAEVAVGVTVGVFLGDLFMEFFGTGLWQIMVAVAVAMSITTWLGARTLMVTQSAVQAAAVMTILPGADVGITRWQDALVGCSIALVIATIAPTSPVDRPRLIAAKVLHEAAYSVRAMVEALRARDAESAEQILGRARATEREMSALLTATSEGVSVVRSSPFLRRHRDEAMQVADLVVPLDRFIRNLRVLARRTAVATWRDEEVPGEYLEMLTELAQVIDECAAELFARRLPTTKLGMLHDLAGRTAHAPVLPRLSATVILAQMRSMLIDLMELCGEDYTDARAAVPDMD